jgi:hypothetical protein
MFKQNLKQFVSSKTNWVSLVGIGFGVYGLVTNTLTADAAYLMVEAGLLGIGVRDAI